MIGPAWLFCPADRPDRYRKALERADAAIIDLEDAVATDRKAAAREALVSTPLDPERVVVRVNPAASPAFAADLDALADTAYTTIMLAKAERPQQLDLVSTYRVIALCETPLGVVNAAVIAAHPAVAGLMWGAEDLVAATGGRSSRFADGGYRDVARHARSTVLLAAAAHGRVAVDAVHTAIDDHAGLVAEAEDAAASGFVATACIHPTQVPIVRAAFRPTAEDVARAKLILEAAEQGGVVSVDGQMIDEPLLRQARSVLAGAVAVPQAAGGNGNRTSR